MQENYLTNNLFCVKTRLMFMELPKLMKTQSKTHQSSLKLLPCCLSITQIALRKVEGVHRSPRCLVNRPIS